jgi:hypothetical protein
MKQKRIQHIKQQDVVVSTLTLMSVRSSAALSTMLVTYSNGTPVLSLISFFAFNSLSPFFSVGFSQCVPFENLISIGIYGWT